MPRAAERQFASADALGVLRWLRRALVAAIVVPALLCIGAAWYDRERLLGEAAADAQHTAALLREHALKAIETQELLIRQLDYRIRGMSWEQIRAVAPALSAEMRAMHEGLPQVSALTLADKNGVIQAASVPFQSADSSSVAHREFWIAQRDADRGTFISRAYTGRATQRANFGISRRIMTPDGSFAGTIHVAVAVSYFHEFWAEAQEDAAGAISLVRMDGEVLARYPPVERATTRLSETESPLMRALQDGKDHGIVRGVSSIDGTERIFAFARVGRHPVVVRFGISSEAVLAGWRQHTILLGIITVGASGSLAFIVLWAMRQVRQLAAEQARRAAVEAAAQEGQRMELLGQLAAGVAHDFANVMQAVSGGAALIERSADQPERTRTLAHMIIAAARQGESLTRRMLSFARQDTEGMEGSEPPMSDPAASITEICRFLATTLGSLYRLDCRIGPDVPALVHGARTALEAAVMNLVVNARDAMPGGGEIVVLVSGEAVLPAAEDATAHPAELQSGSYVRIAVRDTGQGMPPDVLRRAGEMFFTTKPRGRGTGLGLAGTRGFVEQAGGALRIESRVDHGTTVTFWLPAAPSVEEMADRPPAEEGDRQVSADRSAGDRPAVDRPTDPESASRGPTAIITG